MARVRHTETFEMPLPAADLFPLFSAEGEVDWVPGWSYQNVMGSTDLHEDYVFVTEGHDHQATPAVWIVKRYEPEDWHVQFYRVETGDKVGIVTVKLDEREDETTKVEVTYEYIGLSEQGDEFIDGFTEEIYRGFIGQWKTLLDDYFARQST